MQLPSLNRFSLRITLLATSAVMLVPATSSAAPPACKRWRNTIDPCKALGLPNGCLPLSGLDNEKFNRITFNSSAFAACKKLFKTAPPSGYVGQPFKACAWNKHDSTDDTCYPVNGKYPADEPGPNPVPTNAHCVYDVNERGDRDFGDINWNDASQLLITVSEVTVEPEEHCFCTVKGPYNGLSWSGHMSPSDAANTVLRHTFPREMKKAILRVNSGNGGYHTDAVDQETGIPFDPNLDLQKDDIYAPDAAEIDHIIPRVDSQGCLCGDPTPENAAVISRELNGGMSNTSPLYDKNRSAMFKAYATCSMPSVYEYKGPRAFVSAPFDLEQQQLDETSQGTDEDETCQTTRAREVPEDTTEVGCSTSRGGASFALGGLGVALMLRRRRRARA